MSGKRSVSWGPTWEEEVKRQRLLEIPINFDQLESLWVTEIFPRMKNARTVLGLASTCRYFRNLYGQQPNLFWYNQCVRWYSDAPVYSPNINYKEIFTSATLHRCITCHTQMLTTDHELPTRIAYLHNTCEPRNPVVWVKEVRNVFHLASKLFRNLPITRQRGASYYFFVDAQNLAYEYCGSKEKWEQKCAKSLKLHETTQQKKEIDRQQNFKLLFDPIVAALGNSFECEKWNSKAVLRYISTGRTPWWSEAKHKQLEKLSWSELYCRSARIVAKELEKPILSVKKTEITDWLKSNPETLAIFNSHRISFDSVF